MRDEVISVRVSSPGYRTVCLFPFVESCSPHTPDRVGGRKKEKSSLWVDIILPLGFSWLLLACLLAMIAVVPKRSRFICSMGYYRFRIPFCGLDSHGAHKDMDSPDYHGANYSR